MENKCNKYESLFIFSDEKTLLEHVSTCEECKKEHDKMQKVSELIKEVKPKLKKKQVVKLKIACALLFLMVSAASINFADRQYGVLDIVNYGEQLTMEDLGIPTDNYGLIMVD